MSFSGNVLTDNTEITITNDGWFPDLSMDEFLRDYRVPGDYAEDMVRSQLALSVSEINDNLEGWRLDQEAAGYTNLTGIPAPVIDGISKHERLYRRAVFCRAKAELLMQFATMTRKDTAENTAKEAPETEDKFLQYSVSAQRKLMGLTKFGVELL